MLDPNEYVKLALPFRRAGRPIRDSGGRRRTCDVESGPQQAKTAKSLSLVVVRTLVTDTKQVGIFNLRLITIIINVVSYRM